jgi:protein-S-isoprenylcysteine O-methyltransferase Ste14
MMLLRHLLAIMVLPFVVAVVIPIWVGRRNHVTLALNATPLQHIEQFVGLCLVLIGLLLFVSSLRRFAGDGKGTLAPWDPPRQLVVSGPYRYVRNPMISGVLFVLFGEALILLSPPHLSWALTFLVINAIYIPLLEEPQLRSRFGASYAEYCDHVPRLIPRLWPWTPPGSTVL